MVVVRGYDTLKSKTIKRSFSRPSGYGQAVFGISHYGLFSLHGGVYQMRKRKGGAIIVLEKYYWPTQQRGGAQDVSRAVFASAVSAWQALSQPEKDTWNNSPKNIKMSGYNRFLRYFIKNP